MTIVGVDGSAKQVVLDSPRRFAAPEWSPDGKSLIVNGGGRLWRLPAAGGTPEPIATGAVPWIDINHGISPDGKTLAFTAGGSLFRVPASGGEPARVTPAAPSYFHAWSPDGKSLAYSANRGSGYDVYAIAPEGGAERRLTTDPRPDDAPQYSPDGRWIYFLSDRGGTSRHLADARRRRRPGRRQGRADHRRRSRRRGAPPLARRQVAGLPLLPAPDRRQRRSTATS